MKLNAIILLLFFCSFIGCSTNRLAKENTTDLRKEARDYSLLVVKSYFNEDCSVFYNSLSDSTLLMGKQRVYSKIEKKERLCQSVKNAVRDKEKTYQDYLLSYKIEVLTPNEFIDKFNKPLPKHLNITESDFFFLGYELKEGKDRSENFIWDDMFFFMVRKENQSWTIKGISG